MEEERNRYPFNQLPAPPEHFAPEGKQYVCISCGAVVVRKNSAHKTPGPRSRTCNEPSKLVNKPKN